MFRSAPGRESDAKLHQLKKGYLQPCPLHLAAWNGHWATVEALLQLGADTKALNGRRETPVQKAREQGMMNCSELLECWEAGPQPRYVESNNISVEFPKYEARGCKRESRESDAKLLQLKKVF